MLKFIMKKYALSRQGAKDLVIATVSCVVHNLTLMLPVSLLYLLVSDLYAGGVPQGHLWIYIVGMVAAVLLTSESATFQTSLRPLWRIAPRSNSPFRTGYPNFSVR